MDVACARARKLEPPATTHAAGEWRCYHRRQCQTGLRPLRHFGYDRRRVAVATADPSNRRKPKLRTKECSRCQAGCRRFTFSRRPQQVYIRRSHLVARRGRTRDWQWASRTGSRQSCTERWRPPRQIGGTRERAGGLACWRLIRGRLIGAPGRRARSMHPPWRSPRLVLRGWLSWTARRPQGSATSRTAVPDVRLGARPEIRPVNSEKTHSLEKPPCLEKLTHALLNGVLAWIRRFERRHDGFRF